MTSNNEQRKRNNKKLLKISAILFVLVALLLIVVVASTNSEDSKSNVQTTLSNEQASLSRERSAVCDELIRSAKKDVESGITEEQTNEAVEYIYNHYDNYFENDEIMEKCIYYGSLLQYAYEDDYKTDLTAKAYTDLGSDIVRLVKYVYRGAESSTEERMNINLEQIKEDLIYLGYEF